MSSKKPSTWQRRVTAPRAAPMESVADSPMPLLGAPPTLDLSVVIPTRDRADQLVVCLRHLEDELDATWGEVIVIDDGSRESIEETLEEAALTMRCALTVIRQQGEGPAAARNRGIQAARGRICLMIGDDIRLRPGVVEMHRRFHQQHPESTAALLGKVVPAAPLNSSSLIRWLHSEGVQFGYAHFRSGEAVDGIYLYTSHCSVKTGLLRRVGGFSEVFSEAAGEDIELGARLTAYGMVLTYREEFTGEHFHPTDLMRALDRAKRVGVAGGKLAERFAYPHVPSRPKPWHRLVILILTLAYRIGFRPPNVRRAAWTVLFAEAYREGFWRSDSCGWAPTRASALARMAAAEPAARSPVPLE